ncbi:UDP-N-acetylglucosamine--N-acetylmuramyl-(pentapeptide) pyrophosphoryl-undecaprenol N-acetylglucosamine transferase, partial [bacterium]|nr:UDP-N-acetylglucosamine--N-acetylmuramyl-(pentapeptide) pyrophosphoryl-undecaprenol N-acetylglucosamine transferase [bacterium]
GNTIRRYGFPFLPIMASRGGILELGVGFFRAFNRMIRERPLVVVATGGKVTFPVGLAAWLLRIPLIVLEQNRIAGRTNRILALLAAKVVVAFEGTIGVRGGKVVVWGNPVRRHFVSDAWLPAIVEAFSGSPVMLVFGGSQGANEVNQRVSKWYGAIFAAGYRIVHILGPKAYESAGFQGEFEWIKSDAGEHIGVVVPYAEGMDVLYRLATVVVSRAGATTIAELQAFNKPAVLIPFPYAKDDHQRANADVMLARKMAVVIQESELDCDRLLAAVGELRSVEMVTCSNPTAAERVADLVRKGGRL